MGEVNGSKPDAVQVKRKKKCARSLRNKKQKREEWSYGKGKSARGQRGLARGSAQSIPLLFIQSVVIINVYIQYLRE